MYRMSWKSCPSFIGHKLFTFKCDNFVYFLEHPECSQEKTFRSKDESGNEL